MEDISFFGGGGSSGGGSGTTNYNELTNKPVRNISGAPVVISTLTTGVYNVSGTWIMTDGAEVFETLEDDLFYVTKTATSCKLTRVSADGVYSANYILGDSPEKVEYDTVATVNEATTEVMNNLWGEF